MAYTVRDYNPQDPRDAVRLADMFNDFDSAWPGGFTRGIEETPERMRERMERLPRLVVLVVECDDALVGYCDLQAQPGQRERAYVDLLGARLSHHGRGVGKMLLREMVGRAAALGFPQLTLHTWAGNTKAVPLYKKTGFHWVPETNVFMRNFIPAVLGLPAGRALFASRDWYDCHVREVCVAPDDVTWHGMKVYPYAFQDGDDYLRLVFDANAEALTSIETPAFSAACWVPTEEAPAGEAFPVTWQIRAAGRPVDVVLLAETDDGLDLRVQERLNVAGAATVTREMRVLPDAEPRREGERAHAVRTTLLVDGDPLVLTTGVKVVRPVQIDFAGCGLVAGKREHIEVRLRSRVDRDLAGTLALELPRGLECESAVRTFVLPARSWTQCEVEVTAREAGAHHGRLLFDAGSIRASRPLAFRTLSGPGTVATRDADYDETATLQGPALLAGSNLRGGGLWIRHTARDRGLVSVERAELGPPFGDWYQRPPLYSSRIERGPGGDTVRLWAPSLEVPGLVVERSIALAAGDLVRLDHRVRNTTDAPARASLRFGSDTPLNGCLVAPTPAGLIREPTRGWGEFPEGDVDLLAHQAHMAEGWAAVEEDGLVVGLVWPSGPREEFRWSLLPWLTFDVGEVPAHGAADLPPVYVVAGEGGWQTVRAWWRRLLQPGGTHEQAPPEPARILEVGFAGGPALVTDDGEPVRVSVVSRRGKTVSGTLTLAGDQFRPTAGPMRVEQLDRDRPFDAVVPLESPAEPTAGWVEARLDLGPTAETFRLPAIRVGAGGRVDVQERRVGVFSVDNGRLALQIAPSHAGSLTSIERGGTNHLMTSYPEPRPFEWINPWFGGVHPFLEHPGDPRLGREVFTGTPVERTGERGIRWSGVCVSAEPAHRDLRWLRIEVDYLTCPGSNLVAVVSRWANRAGARMQAPGDPGIAAFVQPGGAVVDNVAHWEREGERRARGRGGYQIDAQAGPWAAVENPATGDVLVLVAADQEGWCRVYDAAAHGAHMATRAGLDLGPGETREVLSWIALFRGLQCLEPYAAALTKLRILP